MIAYGGNRRGRVLNIAVGIMALVLVMAGVAGATKIINDDTTGGDCTSIGTWNGATKTCTMTTNLTEGIIIDSNSMTLDGNGHTITGSILEIGIYISNISNTLVKNLNIKEFNTGVALDNSNNNYLININASNNNNSGIYLDYSSNNTLSQNTANSNYYFGISIQSSSNNTLSENNADKNGYRVGTILYNGAGISIRSSSNNTLSGNNVSNNFYGIFLGYSSSNNTLRGNNASNNYYGIGLDSSSNNTLSNNNASNNGDFAGIGIYLYSSSNNTLINNNANSNNNRGISLYFSSNNNLNGNNASNNPYGISLYYSSSNNTIYNNVFINNINFVSSTSVNRWNITKTPSTNIIGGSYLGGNIWASSSGTGFSQKCKDSEGDGICDSTYSLDSTNIDYLPLAIQSVSVLTSITVLPASTSVVVGGTQTFTASSRDQDGNTIAATITWSSSNTTVGTITQTGLFTALANGTTTVTAIADSIVGSATIRVGVNLVDSYLPPGATPAERKAGLIRAMDDYFDNGELTKAELLSILDAYFA